MLQRQRLAIHPDGDHRVAPVERNLDRETTRPPVEAGAEYLLRTGLYSCPVEQIAQHDASEHCVADEIAAHFVGHAAQRHNPFLLRQSQQVGVGELHRRVDHALDLEAPRVDVDIGERQGSVDSVELVVGGDVRRLVEDLSVGRNVLHRSVGDGVGQGRLNAFTDLIDASFLDSLGHAPGDDRSGSGGATGDEEPSAVPTSRRSRFTIWAVRRGLHHSIEHECTGHRTEDARKSGADCLVRAIGGGKGTNDTERSDTCDAPPHAARGEQADADGGQRQDGDDADA